MAQHLKLVLAGVYMTICHGLLVIGIFVGDPAVIGSWAVVNGLMGVLFALWHIVTAERLRVEQLADFFASAADECDVKRIR